ncbi:MAG: hypothetical protein JO151_11770 [Verrucomicrobia bacterium]|nr:hypothetical protein [Verrucomicrobiota bacterium]
MNRFIALLAILFIPALSQAKLIGQKKADFEATHGKSIKLEALAPEIPNQRYITQALPKVLGELDMYKTDFWPEDIIKQQPILGYIGVWYSLGKVAAVWYPDIGKDETIVRALEDALGTSDLSNEMGIFTNARAYRTTDYKYLADVYAGLFVGDANFMRNTVRHAIKDLDEEAVKIKDSDTK